MMFRSFRATAGTLVSLAFVACSTYTPAPLEPAGILRELRDAPQILPAAETLSPAAATATALAFNPELRAVRKAVGVADSLLLEAGVWPDINLGWDAMDWIVGGTGDDALAGLSFGVSLFRPGERDALLADAGASRNLVRARLSAAEWRLTRRVRHQYVAIAAAQEQLALTRSAQQLAADTVAFLRRGLDTGAATRLDVEMAVLQDAETHHRLQAAQREVEVARVKLNAILGAQPDADYGISPLSELQDAWPVPQAEDAAALTDLALAQRPDVQEGQAQYQLAESALRLEVARQWPGMAIGTGISVSLPLFSGFNEQAIETATLRRDQAASFLKAAIAGVRNEAWLVFREAEGRDQEWASYRDRVTPSLETSLRLAERAQKVGTSSHLEVLFAQRQLNGARCEGIDVFAAHLRARADLAWFLGAIASSTQNETVQ